MNTPDKPACLLFRWLWKMHAFRKLKKADNPNSARENKNGQHQLTQIISTDDPKHMIKCSRRLDLKTSLPSIGSGSPLHAEPYLFFRKI
jgi:hypothetical protein